MPDGLYERDALAWAEQQADLLRRRAAGEPRIDPSGIYAKALRRVGTLQDVGGAARPLPGSCPFTLDELLAGNIAVLSGKLRSATSCAVPERKSRS